MANIFYDKDADPNLIKGKKVAEGVEFYIAAASNEVQAQC